MHYRNYIQDVIRNKNNVLHINISSKHRIWMCVIECKQIKQNSSF